MCPWWLLAQLVGQTLEWPVRDEPVIFHNLWFIHFSRPTCIWNSAEIFFWVFPRVQPQYSPKPIQILVNKPRPEQWWLMFSTHFQYIFLTWNWLKFVHLPSWLKNLFADWLGYVTIIYYHTNITVASHVHKITGNSTICSIVCSVKEKEKIRTTLYWSF